MKRGPKGRDMAAIDAAIRRYYSDHGPDFVADKVGESRAYIQSRAWYLKIRTRATQKSGKKKQTKDSIIEELKKRNHQLRRDNIELVNRNRRLKRMILIVPSEGEYE